VSTQAQKTVDRMQAELVQLRADIARYRQALFDVMREAGEDVSDFHPDYKAPPVGVLTPDVDVLAVEAVRELRRELVIADDAEIERMMRS
jgi:hypothetical protein